MIAAIGTGGIPRPNRRLVSNTPRLHLRSLPSFGKSVNLVWKNPASAPPTRVSWTAEGILLETAGSSVRVALREWKMPFGRGGDHGIRIRMVCPRCGAFRDALHWAGEWGCRSADCLSISHASRHQQRWCPAIRRRAKLLRKLARCSPRGLKARVLRAQIAREQKAMIANLKRANRDLLRRSQRHARSRRVGPEQ
jgi:hypothetical protein